MPDISNLFGFWEFRKITYGIVQQIQENTTVLINQLPKREKSKSKALTIIDPKTGKPIHL